MTQEEIIAKKKEFIEDTFGSGTWTHDEKDEEWQLESSINNIKFVTIWDDDLLSLLVFSVGKVDENDCLLNIEKEEIEKVLKEIRQWH